MDQKHREEVLEEMREELREEIRATEEKLRKIST
jgi:hypothetical protein